MPVITPITEFCFEYLVITRNNTLRKCMLSEYLKMSLVKLQT